MNLVCKHCRESFSYVEEVMFFDTEGCEIDSQTALENGYAHVACVTCVDENSK